MSWAGSLGPHLRRGPECVHRFAAQGDRTRAELDIGSLRSQLINGGHGAAEKAASEHSEASHANGFFAAGETRRRDGGHGAAEKAASEHSEASHANGFFAAGETRRR